MLRANCIEHDNPFAFPHSDSAIYLNRMFVGSISGIEFGSTDEVLSGNLIGKVWDGPALQIAAGSSRLAIAAGEEGAWQTYIAPAPSDNIERIVSLDSRFVRWIRMNLFSSARGASSIFAKFKSVRKKSDRPDDMVPKKELTDLISSAEIFDHIPSEDAVVWGAEDRLCMIEDGVIHVVKYLARPTFGSRFMMMGNIPAPKIRAADIIAADNAVFGFIVELRDGLAVLGSSDSNWSFEGEPFVNWRVFPTLDLLHESAPSYSRESSDYLLVQSRLFRESKQQSSRN